MENDSQSNVNQRLYISSNARENFRHLNSSNRRRVSNYINREPKSRTYNEDLGSKSAIYNEDTVSKNFRRFLFSTVIVATVVIVKILDFGVANTLEEKITTMLRTGSNIDSKISSAVVSLGDKMGINIDELSKVDERVNTENEVGLQNENLGVHSDSEENVQEVQQSTEQEASEEQIADFYIDDEVLESVFEDEKK